MKVAWPISMPSRYMYARLGRFELSTSSAQYCLTAQDAGCSFGATTNRAMDAPMPPSSRNAPEMRNDHLAPRVLTEHRQPANTSITAWAETGVLHHYMRAKKLTDKRMSARHVADKLMVCIVLTSSKTQAVHGCMNTHGDSHAQTMQRSGEQLPAKATAPHICLIIGPVIFMDTDELHRNADPHTPAASPHWRKHGRCL